MLNSVGLAGLRHADEEHRRQVVSVLRGQTSIAVRDRASSDFLARRGIAHRLVPDAVHALGVLDPLERDPGSGVAIVQASRAVLRRLGHAAVAARLAAQPAAARPAAPPAARRDRDRARRPRRLRARSRGHLRRAAPRADVAILETRRPLELVDHIRRARVRDRDLAPRPHRRGAYGVPRVTLAKRKPTEYARSWDSDMPYDVALADLDHAIEAAVARAPAAASQARSADLALRAHEHLAGARGRGDGAGPHADRARRGAPARGPGRHRARAERAGSRERPAPRVAA